MNSGVAKSAKLRLKGQRMTELERVLEMHKFEQETRTKGYQLIAGIDEAGRGPLCGPVVAAACILPENVFIQGLDDSKKLNELKRERLYHEITEKAICFGIGQASHVEIDEINILNATKLAMKRAVMQLSPQPDFLLIDAVKLTEIDLPQLPIIKGDALSFSIAAASILAKVTRDRLITELSKDFPEYNFAKHKGYGTKEHYVAIEKHGLCSIHRRSFTKKYW